VRHDCRVCTRKAYEDLRAQWGCDGPTAWEQFFLPCACGGEDGCQVCAGTGLEPVHECPNRLLSAGVIPLLELHRVWPQVLPLAGGLYDQPAAYVQAMRLLDQAEARMKREMQEEAEEHAPRG
jgi:hypothetical protein